MKFKLSALLILFVISGFTFAQNSITAINAKDEADDEINIETQLDLPGKNTPEYWVIRSQTMTEFIPLLTKKRTEFKKTAELMADYLARINKAEDFLDSRIKAPDEPKLYAKLIGTLERIEEANIKLPERPLTWEEAVELAMKVILNEGYLPTDVSDEQELQAIKNICSKKEEYAQKVRTELRDTIKKCLDAWFYLEKIGKQSACREYIYLVKEQEEKAEEEQMQKNRANARVLNKQQKIRERQNRLYYNRYNRYYYWYRW